MVYFDHLPQSRAELYADVWIGESHANSWAGFRHDPATVAHTLPPGLVGFIRTFSLLGIYVFNDAERVGDHLRRAGRLGSAMAKGSATLASGRTLNAGALAELDHLFSTCHTEYGMHLRLIDQLPPAPDEACQWHLSFLFLDPVSGKKVRGRESITIPADMTEDQGEEMAKFVHEALLASLGRLRQTSPPPAHA